MAWLWGVFRIGHERRRTEGAPILRRVVAGVAAPLAGVLAGALAGVLVVAMMPGVPAFAASASPGHPPALPHDRSTPVQPVANHYRKPTPMPKWHPTAPVWPSGSAQVDLDARGTAPAAVAVQAGTLPVWIGPAADRSGAKAGQASGSTVPGRVRVQVAPKSAATAVGVDGVLLAVGRADGVTAAGTAHVSLSYGAFADAFGGDWASRLSLVALPACALTTPALAKCRVRTSLVFRNDGAARSLSADVSLPAAPSAVAAQVAGTTDSAQVVLAAVAADGGGAGDFTATSLKPSGSWQAGGAADGFSWSYPISVPQVPGGLVPEVSLSYSSQSVDGLTSSTNNQASWIGDGWEYSPGYIERSYQSCHENPTGPTKTWDSCWSANNQLTMSLGGSSSLLIKDDTSGVYHPQDDANEKVEYLSGASNGAQGGEYFQVTTDDGTRYIFGLNQLPGWVSGNTVTNSVWTEPVFAATSGQPCYDATWANSWCQQAYRWNLDEVIDTHGDTVAYFYKAQTGYYARNLGSTANTPYTRGGYLQMITYGQSSGAQYTSSPAGQVVFNTNGRCDNSPSGCDPSTLSSSTASHWPDVPYDLNCTNGAACTSQSPTFWSEYMLTGIQTQTLVGATETNVDSWSLSHSFPATGETSDRPQTAPSLWLDSITHTGQDTTTLNGSPGGTTPAVTLPPIVFTGTPLANRVNLTDGFPAITRHRLNTITTETGETISVAYSQAVCPSCIPSDPSTNTTLAYPGYWARPGQTDPSVDWFNKYIVTGVTEQDGTGAPPGGNDTIATHYTPVGSPAWHYDDNPLTPTKRRSWSQWRGFQGMTVTTGVSPDPVTKTTYTYFQGMDGDTLPNGGTRHVSVTDSRGDPSIVDADQYSGMTYETQVFNGSATVTDTITDPWASDATATHAFDGSLGLPAQHAYHTGDARTRVFTPLASGATRQTESDSSHDSYGRDIQIDDKGDVSTTADDLCSTGSFADNTSTGWILDKPAEVKTLSVRCGTTNPPTTATVADKLIFYDGSATLGAAPTVGDVTMTQQIQSYAADGTPSYLTAQTRTVDQYGRTRTVKDANNHTTTTAYTPALGAAPTSIKVTDPLSHATTTTYDPLRGLPTKVTDPALYVTSEQYDALGRLTAVYKPGRTTGNPDLAYTYAVSNTAPSVVNTYTLNEDGTQRLSETLLDSMLRAREAQTQTPDGNRNITDTTYNTDGWVSAVTAPYYNANPVSTTFVEAPPGQVDSQTGTLYDGAGRTTDTIAYRLGTETWRTSYVYGGNFTTTIPPTGATPTTTVTDGRDRQTHLIQYLAGKPTDYVNDPPADYTDTVYTYYPDGDRASETDPAGNTWTWQYNLLDQQTDTVDPDAGHTQSTYDNAGNLKTVTNVTDNNKQTTYVYDNDNRKTASYDTTTTSTLTTANQIAGWTYDTIKKGLLTSTVSYSAGDVYTSSVLDYNDYGLPVASEVTLTGTDAALVPSGGYTVSYGYSITGRLSNQQDPAVGGLPLENLFDGSDNFGEPTSLSSTGGATWTYVSAVGYDEYGHPLRYTMPTASGNAWIDMSYDPQTWQLTGVRTTDSTTSGDVDNLTYTYDNTTVSKGAGLLTKTVDTSNQGATVDTQCFTYDYAQRLSQAWTATDSCAATPQPGNSSTVGGPVSPYWQSWTYDSAGSGLRASQTDHDTNGVVANDTTTTYHYPSAGSTDQPHALTNTTATGPGAAGNTATYTSDPSGNTTGITGGTLGDQTLTWNDQGKLATDQTATGITTYAYDADGNLLARRNPGSTTLYLGDTELVQNNSTKAVTAARYYTINGETIAVRSGTAVTILVPDRQGTNQLSIATTAAQTVTRRRYLPFGAPRGTTGTFPGDKGYVGGQNDTTTSLENLGAREYNPQTGRFLSLDPIFEAGDPNQLNGYDYAANNPTTGSDPTGLCFPADEGPGSSTTDTGGSGHSGGTGATNHNWTVNGGYGPGHKGYGPHGNGIVISNDSKPGINYVATMTPNRCDSRTCIPTYTLTIMGERTSCDGNAGIYDGVCFIGKDGYVHDLYGNIGSHPHRPGDINGPYPVSSDPLEVETDATLAWNIFVYRSTPTPTPRPRPSCTPEPTAQIVNAKPSTTMISFDSDVIPCQGISCDIGDFLNGISYAAGWLPAEVCPLCGAISGVAGFGSAFAYFVGGDNKRALSEAVGTGLNLIGGRVAESVAGRVTTWATRNNYFVAETVKNQASVWGGNYAGYWGGNLGSGLYKLWSTS